MMPAIMNVLVDSYVDLEEESQDDEVLVPVTCIDAITKHDNDSYNDECCETIWESSGTICESSGTIQESSGSICDLYLSFLQ